jgi:hypothetical protein
MKSILVFATLFTVLAVPSVASAKGGSLAGAKCEKQIAPQAA